MSVAHIINRNAARSGGGSQGSNKNRPFDSVIPPTLRRVPGLGQRSWPVPVGISAGILFLLAFSLMNNGKHLIYDDIISYSEVKDVTGRTCLAHAPISTVIPLGSTMGTSDCSYSWGQGWNKNSGIRRSTTTNVQAQLQELVSKWSYDKRVENLMAHWPNTLGSKGGGRRRRVLDVGMGQGPWGAAMLGSPELDLEYYVGLDPDVCPPIHARTRDTKVPRKGSERQCAKGYNLKSYPNLTLAEEGIMLACTGENKYHSFEMTGLEMMAAYPDRLALLPGTFETLINQLQLMVFDIIILNTVTEHLSQLQPVFEGLWELMGKGCAKDGTVLIDHHNYMDYSGHHGFPKLAKELETAPQEMLELADWGHLSDDASQSQNPSLNRVRPGDLQALLNVYFDCRCERSYVAQAEKDRLTTERRAHFTKLGFDVELELFTKHLYFECKRRERQYNPAILKQLNLYHSPLDGSYQPQPFTNCA
jgi:hypothetical protein